MVDALFEVGPPQVDPTVAVLWLSDPDANAHRHGIGHPTSRDSLVKLDAEIGRIEQRLGQVGLLDEANVWVTLDHGFLTHTGSVDLGAVFEPFGETLEDVPPRIIVGGGTIFTRAVGPGSFGGRVPGTISFDVARWDHTRSAEILIFCQLERCRE